MTKLLVTITVKQGCWGKAAPLYKELIEKTLKEEGCIEYDFFVDTQDDHKCYLIETWSTKQALDAHMNSEHFVRLVPQIGELLAEKTITFLQKPAQIT